MCTGCRHVIMSIDGITCPHLRHTSVTSALLFFCTAQGSPYTAWPLLRLVGRQVPLPAEGVRVCIVRCVV